MPCGSNLTAGSNPALSAKVVRAKGLRQTGVSPPLLTANRPYKFYCNHFLADSPKGSIEAPVLLVLDAPQCSRIPSARRRQRAARRCRGLARRCMRDLEIDHQRVNRVLYPPEGRLCQSNQTVCISSCFVTQSRVGSLASEG